MDVITVSNSKIEIFQNVTRIEQYDPGTYCIGREEGVPADKLIVTRDSDPSRMEE